MKQSSFIIVTLVITALALMLVASGSEASSVFVSPEQAVIAPDFELKDLEGNTIRLSDLRGKGVVVNFWATWCPPCRHEIPWFIDVQKEYGQQGLHIIGISVDETGPQAVEQFAEKMGINYSVVMADAETSRVFGSIRSLPTTFFIGRDGRVHGRISGMVSRSSLESGVKAILATKPTAGAERPR